jgi:hypothetical protein
VEVAPVLHVILVLTAALEEVSMEVMAVLLVAPPVTQGLKVQVGVEDGLVINLLLAPSVSEET